MIKMDKELLENTCVICNMVYLLSDIEKLGLEKFNEEAHKFAPKYLYKYFPNTRKWIKEEKRYRNFSYEALVDNTVYLQDAENFDDCFDCAIDLDWNKFLHNRLVQYCDYFKVECSKENSAEDLSYALAVKLYEYNTLENILNEKDKYDDILLKGNIEYFAGSIFNLVEQGDDLKLAIIKVISKEYDDFIKDFSKFKISCFSSSPYLNRMWSSQYANDNKGFCLEYEIELSTPEKTALFINTLPVIYSQHRNDVLPLSSDCDKTPTKEFLWQMYFNGFLRKSLHWQDQEEWRLILLDGLIEKNPITFFKIKKLYLGNKMPAKDRMRIIRYCRAHDIEYVGLVRDTNSFNLTECKNDCYICKKAKK